MQLEVEPAGIAHRFSLVVPPPEGRLIGLAISALNAIPAAASLQGILLSEPSISLRVLSAKSILR